MALIAHTKFAGPGAVSSAIDTSGATLLVVVGVQIAFGSIQDSYGNTWSTLSTQGGGAGSSGNIFYVLSPIVGAGHTFQDQNGSNVSSACVLAFDAVTGFDQQNGAGGQSSPAQGGSLTPGQANNLYISGIFGGNDGAAIVDSGFTISDENAFAGGVNYGSAAAYLIQSAATPQNPAWTDSLAFSVGVVNATFNTSSPPPPAPDWFAGSAPDAVLPPPVVAPTWFTFPPLPQPTPSAAYCYRRACTTDHTQCGGSDSLHFKVPVRITDATLKTVANGGHIQHTTTSNGQTVPADLNFYADLGLTTPLTYETESYDPTTGAIVCWVDLPTLSHTVDVVFYLAYGDAATTTFQGNVPATWGTSERLVAHLANGTVLSALDSTAGAHNGTITNTAAIAGVLDGAGDFGGPGSPSRISFGGSVDWGFPGSFTFSCWIKTGTSASAFLLGISGFTTTIELTQTSTPGVQWVVNGMLINTPVTVADGQWHQVVGRFDASTGTGTLLFDGALQVTSAAGFTFTPDTSTALTAGDDALNQGSIAFTGQMDEIRVVATLRSDDWVLQEYNSQQAASTFLTIGAEVFLCGVTFEAPTYPDWLVRAAVVRGWYAAPPAPPVAPPWIAVDAPDQVRRGETGRLGWDTRPLLPPAAPAPTYFTDTFPDQVRSGVKAPEGWYTRPTTPPPAPPLIETTLPQARYSVPLTRTTYTAPVTPPAAPAPTYFVDVFPDQVRRAGHAAPDWLAEPILPPPVPYTEWGQTDPLHLRVSWRDLSDYTEPLRIIQNPVPPLSWGVIYPDHLTVVRSAALLGAAYHAPYGPTPPPHERPLYRRSLQLRIGSRTEPEKL